jgi:hypothetical protein
MTRVGSKRKKKKKKKKKIYIYIVELLVLLKAEKTFLYGGISQLQKQQQKREQTFIYIDNRSCFGLLTAGNTIGLSILVQLCDSGLATSREMTPATNSFTTSHETTENQPVPLSTFITHHHSAMLIVTVSLCYNCVFL